MAAATDFVTLRGLGAVFVSKSAKSRSPADICLYCYADIGEAVASFQDVKGAPKGTMGVVTGHWSGTRLFEEA